jgi:16S rRNA (guanine(527)-N(7))-methyltransferase RsmG
VVDTADKVKELFARSGLGITGGEAKLFLAFYNYLGEKNIDKGLSAITSFEDVVIKHFVDSAIVSKFVELPSPLLDIGSGAGFPAVPLKIIEPGCEMILAENRKDRIKFLIGLVDHLGLFGIDVYPQKVKPDFPIFVRGVITRAVEPAENTLKRCAPFLDPGSRVILMKGSAAGDEIVSVVKSMERYFLLEDDISYTIPETSYSRRLLVFVRREV